MSAALLIAASAILLGCGVSSSDVFDCFLLFPNHYLEKSGTSVVRNVSSTSACLQHCLQRQRANEIPCRSVMWKRNSHDCILSRWSVSQRPNAVKSSQKADVDLYENLCFRGITKSGLYSTAETQTGRTTTAPEDGKLRDKDGTATPLPIRKILKEETFEFRRFRAHHARSVIGTPLPSQALHRVDGESISPLLTTLNSHNSQAALTETRISGGNGDEITPLLSQVDDWIVNLNNRPIRRGKIIPHGTRGTTQPSSTETSTTQATTTTTSVSTTPPPTTPYHAVPNHPTPCYGRIKGHFMWNFEERTLIQASIRQCLLTCLSSTVFFCVSANYNEAEKKCILNGGSVKINRAELSKRQGWDYFENMCHQGERDEQLEGPNRITERQQEPGCFEEHRDSVLDTLDAVIVSNVASIGACIAACQSAKVPCSSLNWIPGSNGCMLFHVTVDSNQLTKSPHASFYVNKCNDGIVTTTKSPKNSSDDYYDQEN